MVFENSLKTGNTKSCGCLNRDRQRETLLDFPKKAHWKEYRAWQAMKERCQCPNHIGYKNYGGRGITVCKEWEESFDQFYRDMGPCPPKYSLDRVNTNGNYEPSNCRWASRQTQANNTRRNTFLTIDGAVKTLREWSRELGICGKTIKSRVQRGMATRKEVAQPLPPKKNRACRILTLEPIGRDDPLRHLAGKAMPVTFWAEAVGMKAVTLRQRLRHMGLRQALTKPVGWSRRPKQRG